MAATTPTSDATTPPFDVRLTYGTKSATVPNVTARTSDLISAARSEFADSLLSDPTTSLRLLCRGKVLDQSRPDSPAFPSGVKTKVAKVVVMATPSGQVAELSSRRSDPLVRGFDDERQGGSASTSGPQQHWGPRTSQHRHYRFVRLQECPDASFGTRPHSKTPHAFRAASFLERLATDPGIVAVMVERELVVNVLGEMDPIDDRLMRKKKTEEGRCLLGYNTNRGLRIDLKLRPDDLDGFLPYEDVAATLIHELSHNWVGEHDALFWANYGQMRVEYLARHATLAAGGYVADGRTTASLAGVADMCQGGLKGIEGRVVEEVEKEMRQHGVPIGMVAPAIRRRCEELEVEGAELPGGHRLGGGKGGAATAGGAAGGAGGGGNPRELALAAAERRARESREKDEKEDAGSSNQ